MVQVPRWSGWWWLTVWPYSLGLDLENQALGTPCVLLLLSK